MKFADLPIPEVLRRQLAARGYETATPVQAAMAAPEAAEGDLVVSSQTGSGKTVAFGLACANVVLDEGGRAAPGKAPRVLVVAPTRELALQVARELSWLYGATGARIASCVGGMDIRREHRVLMDGAQIVVGTPGRLCDHLERESLSLKNLGAVVLDEADEMLDMGFRDELERILKAAPATRRTLLFSATMPKPMEALAKAYTRDAKRISASSLAEPHKDITYIAHAIAPRERDHAVVNVLRSFDAPSALVFCARRDAVNHLQATLVERGFLAEQLSGDLSQAERNRALLAMREGRARVLVATDVAARGLDLPQVALVVHADLPQNTPTLQHRSGRTGRAGRKGTAVLLAPFSQTRLADRLARAAQVALDWRPVPKAKDIRALENARLVDQVGALTEELEEEDRELASELLRRYAPELLAAALVHRERRSVPAPEELPLTAEREAQRAAPRPAGRERVPRSTERPERRPYERHAGEGPARRSYDRHAGEGPVRPERRVPSRAAGGGEGGERRPRSVDARPQREGRRPDGVWFRVNVGREANADPRWLLPLLCRRGGVEKRHIGRIEIGARETRFEVHPSAAEHFGRAASKRDKKDPQIRIDLVRR